MYKKGKLTIYEDNFIYEKGRRKIWCECSCGNKKYIRKDSLDYPYSKSCGCYSLERSTTHGMSKIRFWNIWMGIKNRCLNKKGRSYIDYGKRGIKICKKWLKFENFRDDMYESYLKHVQEFGEKETTIDRIDNNGNYSKENCRWTTIKIQNKNRRSNIPVTYNNKTQCLTDWADELGIPFKALHHRYQRNWDLDRMMTQKLRITKLTKV